MPSIIEVKNCTTNEVLGTFNPNSTNNQITLPDTETNFCFEVIDVTVNCTFDGAIPLVAPATAFMRFVGDTISPIGNGRGTDFTSDAQGTYTAQGAIYDSITLAQTSLNDGDEINIVWLPLNGGAAVSASYTYNNGIDFEVNTPNAGGFSSVTPSNHVPFTYADTTTSGISVQWSEIQLFIQAGSGVDTAGNFTFIFDKRGFATAKGFTDADAFSYLIQVSVSQGGFSSDISEAVMCMQSDGVDLASPDKVFYTTLTNSQLIQTIGTQATDFIGYTIIESDCGDSFSLIKPVENAVLDSTNEALTRATVRSFSNNYPYVVVGNREELDTVSFIYKKESDIFYDWDLANTNMFDKETLGEGLIISGIAFVEGENNFQNGKPMIFVSVSESDGSSIDAYNGTDPELHLVYWNGNFWQWENLTNLGVAQATHGWDYFEADLVQNGVGLYGKGGNRYLSFLGPDVSLASLLDPSNYGTLVQYFTESDLDANINSGEPLDGVSTPDDLFCSNYIGHIENSPAFAAYSPNLNTFVLLYFDGGIINQRVLFKISSAIGGPIVTIDVDENDIDQTLNIADLNIRTKNFTPRLSADSTDGLNTVEFSLGAINLQYESVWTLIFDTTPTGATYTGTWNEVVTKSDNTALGQNSLTSLY